MAEKSIQEVQDEIIEEFSVLSGDMEMTVFYMMELGQKMPAMDEAYRTEDNIVKGCQSKVWLYPEMENDRVQWQCDSNTEITKGLVSLLRRVLNDRSPDDILSAEIYFPEKIGMSRFIGTQRSNGFAAMIKQMRNYAQACKVKMEH
ncbi:SufE family protein [Roseivirga sp. BDSF3-8]|uniref:SufE family protein n=1 Tax=Roseivirga sp. BDSF3-8 TaxID=3241598 RepID=UPI003531F06E